MFVPFIDGELVQVFEMWEFDGGGLEADAAIFFAGSRVESI